MKFVCELVPGGAQTPADVDFWVAASSQTVHRDRLSSTQLLLFHPDLQTCCRNFTRNPKHTTRTHELKLLLCAKETALKIVLGSVSQKTWSPRVSHHNDTDHRATDLLGNQAGGSLIRQGTGLIKVYPDL